MKHQSNPIFIISCFPLTVVSSENKPRKRQLRQFWSVDQSQISSSVLIFLLLLTHSTISTTAQEVEDERDFDYIEGSSKGPEKWGDIKKEWEACKNGSMQSPVELSKLRPQIIPALLETKRTYRPSNATLKNRGHDIMIEWTGNAGSIVIDAIPYRLKQGHWHSPSEHAISGKRYDMELHMVYQSQMRVKNSIAVVGALYQLGQPDAFLSKLRDEIASMSDQKIERSIGVIDPAEVLQLNGRNNYRYLGSLTTPPCTEGVIWLIRKQFGTVSREQIELLRAAVNDYAAMNARPVQPLNRRKLNL